MLSVETTSVVVQSSAAAGTGPVLAGSMFAAGAAADNATKLDRTNAKARENTAKNATFFFPIKSFTSLIFLWINPDLLYMSWKYKKFLELFSIRIFYLDFSTMHE